MGRGKINIRRIENATSRQVTFSKRRAGLLKKAHELSVLCDAEVGLIIFSGTGRMFEFASSSMKTIIERYMKTTEEGENDMTFNDNSKYWKDDVVHLKHKIDRLLTTSKQITGEDVGTFRFKELSQLEQQLEMGLSRIRSRKDKLLIDRIEDVTRKENLLNQENKNLRRQIEDFQSIMEAGTRKNPTGAEDPRCSSSLTTFPYSEPLNQLNVWDSSKNSAISLQLGLFEGGQGAGNQNRGRSSSQGSDVVEQSQDWMSVKDP